MAEKTLLDKFKNAGKTYATVSTLAGMPALLPAAALLKARQMNKGESEGVKAASREGALKYGAEGAALGAGIGQAAIPIPGVGAAVGAAAGFGIGAAIGFGVERAAAKNVEDDQKRIESQQEQIAKQSARQQQQLSREAAGQAKKKGSTKVAASPSNIMLEAAGTGSDFDAWHSRTF